MSDYITIGLWYFIGIMVFGVMVTTYNITSPGRDYVVLPSSHYCESMGYVKQVEKSKDTK
jgi:hypothetical protein